MDDIASMKMVWKGHCFIPATQLYNMFNVCQLELTVHKIFIDASACV